MFKPALVNEEFIRKPQAPLPVEAVNNIFKVMHGFYGNLFLSKFATGVVSASGEDEGIISAREMWGHGLRSFTPGTVKQALAKCMDAHPEFAPSLPQFVALCRACEPREVYKPAQPAIGMSQELRSSYARNLRAINEKFQRRAIDKKTGYQELPLSLDGLKQAIANAVATAGGDEAAELRRLDLMFAPSVST